MFKKGRYVVVTGSSLSADKTKSEYHFELAEIVEVAKYELVVSPINASFKRPYKVAKISCCLLELTDVRTHVPSRRAKIGDFVMYYHAGYDKTSMKLGLLMGIIDRPGCNMVGNILSENEYHEVPYKDLMILEENNYKS